MRNPIEDIKILWGTEREKFIETLNKQFGITEIEGLLIKRGMERIFLFTGSLEPKDIHGISKFNFLERVGVYFAKENEHGELRLSIEGSQAVKHQATKNVYELNDEEMETWMCGHEIVKDSGLRGPILMKYKDDMLGTGKASKEKITNFIPKSRRLKDKTILE